LLSFLTILSAPSHPLSPPAFTSSTYPPPTCHQTTTPFYTLTTCWTTYYINFTQLQPPGIPDTITYTTTIEIHPNTHRPQNPAAPTLLPLLTHPTSCPLCSATLSNFPNFYS
jgi:hypothetical protein